MAAPLFSPHHNLNWSYFACEEMAGKVLSAEELIEQRNAPAPSFPTLGLKCFAPDGSDAEFYAIQDTLLETKKLISCERVRMIGSLSQAIWHPDLQMAEVIHQTGSHWSTMGQVVDKKLYLYPEEALYLLEIGALELKYNGLPLSTQRAYAVVLKPQTEVSLEFYRVYSRLNAHGYRVKRHSSKNVFTKYEKQIEIYNSGIKLKDVEDAEVDTTLKRKIEESNIEYAKKQKSEALNNFHNLPVKSDTDNLHEILDNLKIFETNKINDSNLNVEIDFDVFAMTSKKPFKKSVVQLPNFRVRVFRSDEPVPDSSEFVHLSKIYEDDVPIIYAVVFPDYISFQDIRSVVLPDCKP